MSLYVPRGYVITAEAVQRVFEARHPDLAASALARSVNLQRLHEYFRAEFPGIDPPPAKFIDLIRLRDARLKRSAVIAAAIGPRDALRHPKTTSEQSEQPAGNFGEEDLARLRELCRIETEQHRFESEAAMELRSALAEGDLTADVLTDAGAWVPLDRSHWLGKDGLTTVRRSRLRVQVPGTQTPLVDGTVIIKEDHLMSWIRFISLTDGEQPHPRPVGFSEAAEQVGEQEAATPTPKPDPVPSPSTDLEFIDLKSELPRLPRYTIKGSFPRATEEQVDECIKKIAELHGGKTNRRTIRDWGRHWLRTVRHVDIDITYLEKRFSDPEHEERRRPGGNPRNAG